MRGPDRGVIRIARKLRVNQTNAETVLWNRIRNRQIDGTLENDRAPGRGFDRIIVDDGSSHAGRAIVHVEDQEVGSIRDHRSVIGEVGEPGKCPM